MKTRVAGTVLFLLFVISVALSALVPPPPPVIQDDFEDRPPIIISSGSVILNVARGSWVREAAGRFRQEQARGKDVKSFSARTGTGTSACTVTGETMVVTYGANTIRFGRVLPGARGANRRHTEMRLPEAAKTTTKDAQTLVIETTDPLVSFSNGGTRPQDTCKIVGGRVEIRQVH